jgi:preprotein translocase subunit SecE
MTIFLLCKRSVYELRQSEYTVASCLEDTRNIYANMQNFINYLKDTRAELRHVAWPTQRQAIIYTALVIVISILVALFVGAFDYVFTTGLNLYVK